MNSICVVVLVLTSLSALAADSTTLVIPTITKPLVEPVEGDPLQADYDAMWTEYEEAIKAATAKVTEALEKQSDKAADTGELELVEMWDGMKKTFAAEGKLDWDTSPQAANEWKKKFPKVPFPRELNEAVRTASSLVSSANEKLDERYADLVKAHTKARNIPRAKELRKEVATLLEGARKKFAPDAVLINGHYYKVIWQKDISWTEAAKKCEEEGGYLACLETDDERKALAALKGSGMIVWTGGSRKNGEFSWINGAPFTQSVSDTQLDGTCVSFAFDERLTVRPVTGKSEAHPIKFVHGFICEWDQ